MTTEQAIQNLKEIVNLSEDEINKNDKNISAVLDLEDLKSLRIMLKELEKKDKIVDEMANYIWDYDCCEYEIGKNRKCEGYYINEDCREKCIKQYFEKKAEE